MKTDKCVIELISDPVKMTVMLLLKIFLWGTCSLVCLLNAVVAELVVKPHNTLVELDKETNLMCCSNQSNSVLEWKFQKWNNGDLFIKLCSGLICHRDGYSVDSHSPGCSRLIINSSSVEVAGLYQCNELGTEAVGGAYLVVYQLNCSHNVSSKNELVEGIKVVYTCTALWKGKLPFQIIFSTADGNDIKKHLFSQWQEFYSNSVPVDLLRPRLPSYTFSIQLLSTGITDENVDKHSPVVKWSSTEEQVMYRVSNIRTNCPKKDCEKEKGDLVICSADGFPVPRFQWLDWDLKQVANSSVLQMKSVGNHEYTCSSKNMIHGQEYEVREKIVVNVIEKTEEMSPSMIIVIVVGVVVIFILVIILVAVLFTMYTVLQVAKVYFSENESNCRSLKRETRKSELGISLNSLQVKIDGLSDNYPQKVSEDPEESERFLPVRQTVDADV